MENGCHLVTLRLDAAPIDDVGRGRMVGEVVLPLRAPAGPAGVLWSSAARGGLAPCRARLPDKGGLFLDDILLHWLGLGPSYLHGGPSNLLVSCTLTWAGASILFPCLCTVWATDPVCVAPTEAPGPGMITPLGVVGPGPN